MEIAATIKKVRAQLGFDEFELDITKCSAEERARLKELPRTSQRSTIKVHPTKSKSAYAGMTEPAVIAGYMRTENGIKALVIYSDREDDHGEYDFGFVDLSQVRPFQDKQQKAFSLF